MRRVNVFVLGLDESNLRTMREVPMLAEYRFHPLLRLPELQHGEIAAADLMDRARRMLDAFDGPVDAIVGYWDFPVSTMLPLLSAERGLVSSSLESVLKCEHKYWSRVEQSKVTDAHPNFAVLDPSDRRPPELNYPMWLKPVKSVSSELAFKVSDDDEFRSAMAEIEDGIDRLGAPFEYFLEQVDAPPEISAAGGRAVLAEESMQGVQAAVEGYVYQGEVTVYGALDSLNYEDSNSFLRHQYPSQLPQPLVDEMVDVSKRVITRIGLDDIAFSIEFFCDPDTGQACLLEINPRHSQSHAELFELVDGVPNHHAMLRLALGRRPEMPRGEGPYAIAAKWTLRRFADGIVRNVPTAGDIEQIRQEIDGVDVEIVPALGQHLSEMEGQDAYSFELAHVFTGAQSVGELEKKYDQVVERLPFEFNPVAEEGD